ncbi:hypothetical protein DAEQUDRAFT_539206 [Daedalea quercina L-15889]|uniref:Uncharacterized protein n=1 Tax=Daedalea quercina L-15889 TaxID=1314783 RepID=A0A165M671_9APHY|nr:hypothetical protein DAEQUDRAFT_539206 [Daedalea quercina L-15889]
MADWCSLGHSSAKSSSPSSHSAAVASRCCGLVLASPHCSAAGAVLGARPFSALIHALLRLGGRCPRHAWAWRGGLRCAGARRWLPRRVLAWRGGFHRALARRGSPRCALAGGECLARSRSTCVWRGSAGMSRACARTHSRWGALSSPALKVHGAGPPARPEAHGGRSCGRTGRDRRRWAPPPQRPTQRARAVVHAAQRREPVPGLPWCARCCNDSAAAAGARYCTRAPASAVSCTPGGVGVGHVERGWGHQ